MTSLRSAGSFSTSASLSSSSSCCELLLEPGDELAQVAVGACGVEVVAHRAPLLVASLCGPSSSFSRRPTSAASRWSL